jgi:hypothetical protein
VDLNIRYPIVSFEAARLFEALRPVRSTKVLRILSHSITFLLHVAIFDPRPGWMRLAEMQDGGSAPAYRVSTATLLSLHNA